MTNEQRATWEYLAIPEGDRGRLASLGEEGWELVAAGGLSEEPLLYLKRRQFGFRDRVTLEQRDAYLNGEHAHRPDIKHTGPTGQ